MFLTAQYTCSDLCGKVKTMIIIVKMMTIMRITRSVSKPVVNCCSNRLARRTRREFAESAELETNQPERLQHAVDCTHTTTEQTTWHKKTQQQRPTTIQQARWRLCSTVANVMHWGACQSDLHHIKPSYSNAQNIYLQTSCWMHKIFKVLQYSIMQNHTYSN